MPRRGTELRTDFTGDDSKFSRVVDNQKTKAKQFGAAWETAGKKAKTKVGEISTGLDSMNAKLEKGQIRAKALGVAIALAAAAGKALREDRTAVEETDEMLKLSQRSGSNFEDFQRQASAAKKANVPLMDYANTLTRIARMTETAKKGGNNPKAQAFQSLGIGVDQFSKMTPQGRVRTLAEAFKRAPDKDKALLDLFQIMEDDAKKFLVMFADGARGVADAEAKAVGVISTSHANAAAAFNDAEEDKAAIRRAERVNDISELQALQKAQTKVEEKGGFFAMVQRFAESAVGISGVSKAIKGPMDEVAKAAEPAAKAITKVEAAMAGAADANKKYLEKAPEAANAIEAIARVSSGRIAAFSPDRGPALMNMRTTSTAPHTKTPEFRLLDELKQINSDQHKALMMIVKEL